MWVRPFHLHSVSLCLIQSMFDRCNVTHNDLGTSGANIFFRLWIGWGNDSLIHDEKFLRYCPANENTKTPQWEMTDLLFTSVICGSSLTHGHSRYPGTLCLDPDDSSLTWNRITQWDVRSVSHWGYRGCMFHEHTEVTQTWLPLMWLWDFWPIFLVLFVPLVEAFDSRVMT